MNIHEYQAKQLLGRFNVPTSKGEVVRSIDEVGTVLSYLPTHSRGWVIKAQAHTGGRGEAGGVKLVQEKTKAVAYVESLLGSTLVTRQTGEKGLPVNTVLIEEVCDIERELYLSVLIDREHEGWIILASPEGGMDIESEAGRAKLLQIPIDAVAGLRSHHLRQLANHLQLARPQQAEFATLMHNLLRCFQAKDLSLLELNPLVISKAQGFIALDAKVVVDDNALYRHADIAAFHDTTQEDERESIAKEYGLNYIALEGDIGCMVNGAGLAMATMDLIQLYGGRPANFLDVGGTATVERVSKAFNLILSDTQVKTILVNIFGGIVRCDVIAQGIIQAISDVHVAVPVIVRLEGTNAEQGKQLLKESTVNVIAMDSLADAAKKAVKIVQEAA